jgi:hypothetical protein
VHQAWGKGQTMKPSLVIRYIMVHYFYLDNLLITSNSSLHTLRAEPNSVAFGTISLLPQLCTPRIYRLVCQ